MKGMKSTESILFRHEIKAIDVLCGRCKTTFNHTGNRRFRFVIALNLNRYRYARDRRAKSKVVNSIVRLVQQLEGRFLEKCNENGEFWFPVSLEIVRRKVSHALRDKFPLEALHTSFCSLKAKINFCAVKCNVEEDCLYDEINLRVLQAFIPSMEHASDSYVKTLLAVEVDQYICSLQKVSHESTLEVNKVLAQFGHSSFDHLQSSACGDTSFRSFQNRSCPFSQDMTDVNWKARNHSCKDLGFNGPAIFSNDLEPCPAPFSHIVTFMDRDACNSFTQQQELDISDTSIDDLLVDAQGKIHPTLDTIGDLPQGFTAKDCESLLASLDHMSSLME